LVVQQTKSKDSQTRSLLRENSMLKEELARSRALEGHALDKVKQLEQLVLDQEKIIARRKQAGSLAHSQQALKEAEAHYLKEIKGLEGLLQRQAAVIRKLEGQASRCTQCEIAQQEIREMTSKLAHLQEEVARLGQHDTMR
jgi:hypothetical protein